MPLRVKKFVSAYEMETFLNGGIRGGTPLDGPVQIAHNSTLIFTTPAATVTFSSPTGRLLPAAILTQINAQLGSNGSAKMQDKTLVIEKADGSAPIVLSASGTANGSLGFSSTTATTGKIYGSDPTSPPAVVALAADGSYTLIVAE